MNKHLHPIFADILNRQFAQVFPVKDEPPCAACSGREKAIGEHRWTCGFRMCPHCGADWTIQKPDRLAELQSNLHIKGEQV